MIEQAAHQILLDLFQCLLLALPLALLAQRWLGLPTLALAGFDGRPRPGTPSDVMDLVLAIGLVFLLRSQMPAPAAPGAASHSLADLSPADLLAGLGSQALLLLALLAYLSGARGRPLAGWFGLYKDRVFSAMAWALLWTLAGGAAVYVASGLVNQWLWEPLGFTAEPQQLVRLFTEAHDPGLRLLIMFNACLAAPVIEETVFRGYLYPVLRQFTDAPFAALFTAMLFGLVHGSLHGFVPLSLLGLALALAYEHGRGLALPVAIHAYFNAATVALLWNDGGPR